MINLRVPPTPPWGEAGCRWTGAQSDIFTHVQRENRAGCQACEFPKTTLLRPPQGHENSVRKVKSATDKNQPSSCSLGRSLGVRLTCDASLGSSYKILHSWMKELPRKSHIHHLSSKEWIKSKNLVTQTLPSSLSLSVSHWTFFLIKINFFSLFF